MVRGAGRRSRRADLNPFYVLFDLALAALALRSLSVLGRRAPWTSSGWAATACYGVNAALAYTGHGWRPGIAILAYASLIVLGVTFVVAAIRREPRAEPWWWPRR